MGFDMPDSMDKCVYFTRRKLENNGRIIAWAEKVLCPECGKGLMGKPVEKGKIKVRASEYVCPECGYSEEKKEHEEKLEVKVIYTCPSCSHEGETTTEYKRKKWMGVDAFVFKCDSCGAKIGITKKMKAAKK
jgi:predicted RNA-binding Zn-ribbon protein involved in translation (DUF1610 family)